MTDQSSEWFLLALSHFTAPMVNAVSKPPTVTTASCAEAFIVLRSGHNEITAVSMLSYFVTVCVLGRTSFIMGTKVTRVELRLYRQSAFGNLRLRSKQRWILDIRNS
jgi:hypothetical protein